VPRLKSAGRLARERLTAPDISETERIALLKIIAGDERRKTNERIAKINPGAKRYSKKAKQAVPQAYKNFVPPEEQTKSSKKDKRNLETSVHTKSQTLGEFLLTMPAESLEPVVETAPVVEPVKPAVESPAPQPAPVVVPVLVEEVKY
jgi:hypothetical protein